MPDWNKIAKRLQDDIIAFEEKIEAEESEEEKDREELYEMYEESFELQQQIGAGNGPFIIYTFEAHIN